MNSSGFLRCLTDLLRSPEGDILKLIRTAPHQYRHYQIPKRSGGMRDIYHPTPALKVVQRWLVREVFVNLPVHQSVFSYRRGISISDHAAQHLESNFFLRLDFSDFFPSITSKWLESYLNSQRVAGALDVDGDVVPVIVRLVCRRDRLNGVLALSIGAPSSPMLSNAVLYEMDKRLSEACERRECVYTRYADDLFISSRNRDIRSDIEPVVRGLIRNTVPHLALNERKTGRFSRKRRVLIAGVVLTPQRKLSIGRDVKRRIKTEFYLWTRGQLSSEACAALRGLISHAVSIEPQIRQGLSRKFGVSRVQEFLGG